nr:MAG TPA: hypothetical protein [Caudoviricetes sp.]
MPVSTSSQVHRNRRTPQTLNCICGVLLTKEEGAVAQNRKLYSTMLHYLRKDSRPNAPAIALRQVRSLEI